MTRKYITFPGFMTGNTVMNSFYDDKSVRKLLTDTMKWNLEGIFSTYIDNFNLAGSEKFLTMVTEAIRKALDVSKVEASGSPGLMCKI